MRKPWAGQTLSDSFGYTMKDGSGVTSSATLAVTITGTNDAPVLSPTTSPAAVTELPDAAAQVVGPIAGTFPVADKDVGDALAPTVVGSPVVLLDGAPFTLPAGAQSLVANTAFALSGATSDGGSVSIGYTYAPAAADLDFLREGQSLTITYTVKVNDGTADSGTQDVTFTITGTSAWPKPAPATSPSPGPGSGWGRPGTWPQSSGPTPPGWTTGPTSTPSACCSTSS